MTATATATATAYALASAPPSASQERRDSNGESDSAAASGPLVADVVLGAGPLGCAVAAELQRRGRPLRLLNRKGGSVAGITAVACPEGNLAAALADLPTDRPLRLFVCAAPAYHRWPQEFPALVDAIRRAVAGRHCDIVYADNLYAYGPSDQPHTEASALVATTVKGRVRAEAARALLALHRDEGPVRVAIVRGSSFFGPGVEQSALGASVLRAARDRKPVPLLGDPGQPHALTYLPDFARCMLRVAELPQALGSSWHVPNSPARPLRAWLADFAPAGVSAPRERVAGRFLLGLLGLFNPQMRELREVLYQFEQPLLVDHTHSASVLGLTPTPAPVAVAQTQAWLAAQPRAGGRSAP